MTTVNYPINPFDPPKESYDARSTAHQSWLLWWLDLYQVRFSELDEVGFLLHGKPAHTLPTLVERVKRRRVPDGGKDSPPSHPSFAKKSPVRDSQKKQMSELRDFLKDKKEQRR